MNNMVDDYFLADALDWYRGTLRELEGYMPGASNKYPPNPTCWDELDDLVLELDGELEYARGKFYAMGL